VIQGFFPGGKPRIIQASPAPATPVRTPLPAPLQARPAKPALQPATRPGQPPRPILPTNTLQPRTAHPAAPVRPQAPQPILPKSAATGAMQPHAGNAFALPAGFGLKRRGSGQPLPEPVQKKMEAFFNTSFADVRVHVGAEASSIGALAFTHGTDLYFAPGQYNPQSTQGQQLLGHELTHVLQQRAGRVRNPLGSGVAVLQDPALEAEAERMGMRAGSWCLPIQTKPNTVVAAGAPSTAGESPSRVFHSNCAAPVSRPVPPALPRQAGAILPKVSPAPVKRAFDTPLPRLASSPEQTTLCRPSSRGPALPHAQVLLPKRASRLLAGHSLANSQATSPDSRVSQLESNAKAIPGVYLHPASQRVIQSYTRIPKKAQKKNYWKGLKGDLRVSDDGNMAVLDTPENVSLSTKYQEFYATSELIAEIQLRLWKQSSGYQVERGTKTLRGRAPDGSGDRTLYQVIVKSKDLANQALEMRAPEICNVNMMFLMGAYRRFDEKGNATQRPRKPYTRFASPVNESRDVHIGTGRDTDAGAKSLRAHLLGAEPGKIGLGGQYDQFFKDMTDEERRQIAEQYGINQYAAPEIGEGIGIVELGKGGTHFHFAGVIARSGQDIVTLENYAGNAAYGNGTKLNYRGSNEFWFYRMYGPVKQQGAEDQTFYGQNKGRMLNNSLEFGRFPMVIRVRSEDEPD
jgi:hypothetical protein